MDVITVVLFGALAVFSCVGAAYLFDGGDVGGSVFGAFCFVLFGAAVVAALLHW